MVPLETEFRLEPRSHLCGRRDLGLLPYGRRASTNPDAATPALAPMAALRYAARTPAFWVLAGTFFICGASTNGLIGTTASGWLTDRYSSRHLLFGYYALRGLSLLYLPVAPQQGAPELGWCAGTTTWPSGSPARCAWSPERRSWPLGAAFISTPIDMPIPAQAG